MFDIGFRDESPEVLEDGTLGAWGRIVLGDFSERFLSPIAEWPLEVYESQWLDAAARLLGPDARAGFFTVPFQFWWTMWRQGERILIHEEFLTPERLAAITDYENPPYHLIEEFEASNQDGDPVSEWEIGAGDVRDFIARRLLMLGAAGVSPADGTAG